MILVLPFALALAHSTGCLWQKFSFIFLFILWQFVVVRSHCAMIMIVFRHVTIICYFSLQLCPSSVLICLTSSSWDLICFLQIHLKLNLMPVARLADSFGGLKFNYADLFHFGVAYKIYYAYDVYALFHCRWPKYRQL